MAAHTDLSAYPIGDCYTVTTAATWLGFNLPASARTVTLVTEGAVYLAPPRAGGSAVVDGAAVGTHRVLIPSGAVVTLPLVGTRTIFLAQTSAAEKVTILFDASSP
jgi:hypothetical protein